MIICKKCGSILKLVPTPNKIHYGRIDCPNCGFIRWAKNPETKDKPKRPKTKGRDINGVCEFHGFNKEFCFLCLRTREQLGENETLTVDHILEKNIGGEDRKENMQVLCSACHKIKNWLRLYLNWHLNGKND